MNTIMWFKIPKVQKGKWQQECGLPARTWGELGVGR